MTILVTMTAKGSHRTIGAGEFKAKCLELMDDVARSGEAIVITKRGKPVAKLGPVVEKPAALFGYLKGNFSYVGDVVAPLDVEWGPAAPQIRAPRRGRAR